MKKPKYASIASLTLFLVVVLMTACNATIVGGQNHLAVEQSSSNTPVVRSEPETASQQSGEDWHSPGALLPQGPRLLVQRPDNSIQYLSLDGSSATLVADAPASLIPAGFAGAYMTDGPMVYLRQWFGGFYILDTKTGNLTPLAFIPTDSSPLAVRPSDELSVEGEPLNLAWGEFSATSDATTRLRLAVPDGSRQTEALATSFEMADAWTRLIPWRWRRDGQLYFTKDPVDGRGGFPPFISAANLWILDPQTSTSTELVSESVTGGRLCLDAIAPEYRLVAHHCNAGKITLLDIKTGVATAVSLPDQVTDEVFLGSVRFSPDRSRIAFAAMIGGFGLMEETKGYVMVSTSLSGDSQVVATSESGEWFSVAAWLTEDRLVLQSTNSGPDHWPAVWTVKTDNTSLVKLADGTFLAMFDG